MYLVSSFQPPLLDFLKRDGFDVNPVATVKKKFNKKRLLLIMSIGKIILVLGGLVLLTYFSLICMVHGKGHTNVVTSPYNYLIQLGTVKALDLRPILPLNLFPEHVVLESHYKEIRAEILTFLEHHVPLASHESSPITFGRSFADDGWRLVMLRFYNKEFPHVQSHFPQTMKYLPEGVRIAMFSILLPHHRIAPHVGPFRGSMRYHLGLQIPQDRNNCFIDIDRTRYHWKEGESLLFDDTYIHQVYNNTSERRIVLFLDIQRTTPSLSPLMNWINHQVCHSSLIHSLSQLNDQNETPQRITKQ